MIFGNLEYGMEFNRPFQKTQEVLSLIWQFLKNSCFRLIPQNAGFNLGSMGYSDKLRKLCLLRGLDQNTLAQRVGISKSSMSRILNGEQEPKLILAYNLAQELQVTLDSLLDDSDPVDATSSLVTLTQSQITILDLVDRLGYDTALNRLLAVNGTSEPTDLHSHSARNETSESSEATSRVTTGKPHIVARRSR